MTSSDDVSHVILLNDSLHQVLTEHVTQHDVVKSRDEYGFRKSGIATPIDNPLVNLVPDPNGLGWPGKLSMPSYYVSS
jgi:hypothetical protein